MKKRFLIILCICLFLLNGMVVYANESDKVITDVVLPYDYTEFYAGLSVTSPQFYDTINCKVNGEDTTVSGVTWTSNDYAAATVGVYTFSAVAPEGYQFAEAETPTITVRVRHIEDGKGLVTRGGYFFSRYPSGNSYDTNNATGFHAMVKPSGDTKNPNSIYDITGFNKIFTDNASQRIKLLGGMDYSGLQAGKSYAEDKKELNSNIALDGEDTGATIAAMYGGSYGNVFYGITNIYVNNGTLTEGIYAGSLNGDFEGTTNIYLSGNSSVPKIYLGSTYNDTVKQSSKVIGEADVSYKGTINVYIADDFTGSIGEIVAATGTEDVVTTNIYLSGQAQVQLPVLAGDINVYRDNVAVPRNVTSISYEGERTMNVPLDTAMESLGLGDTLQVTCGDITYIEKGVTWECTPEYSSNTTGTYIFTPVLPESYNVESSLLPTVTVQVQGVAEIIEAVTLPFDYTELYTKLNVTTPVFYDTLACEVEGVDTTLSGFTWNSADYKADTIGTYTFTASAPVGYEFAEGAAPTITVRVREAEEDPSNFGAIDRYGHFFSNDKYDSETLTGFYGMAVTGLNDSGKTRVVDFTGFNPIRPADTSNNIRLMGGVDYAACDLLPEGTVLGNKYAANPTELTSKIALSSGKMHSMYGGSYGNIFKGTTDIYVTGGSLSDGIYAGSVNGDFVGTTNIYISGDAIIERLHLGSVYKEEATHIYKGITVGKQDVSYDGTINVYIADDFTGRIGEIVVPNGENDNIDANIHVSSVCAFDIFSMGYEGATLYIDGVDVSPYMSEVKYDGETFIVVPTETEKSELAFNGTLTFGYGGKECMLSNAEWDCASYDPDAAGAYQFTPVLPEEYAPTNEPVLPVVEVVVESGIAVDSIDVGIALETRLPEGVEVLNLPTKAMITYTYAGNTYTKEISISYDVENYKPEKGEYILSIRTLEAPYTLSEAAKAMSDIKVEVSDDLTYEKSGDVYIFDSAMVAFWAETRGKYTITDASKLYTYYDNVTVVDAIEISGKDPALTIESPVVYVEDTITFKDIEGEAKAEVATALVTKIRTACPEKVTVNGISLGSYNEKTVTEISGPRTEGSEEKGTLYLNGIPTVIARDEDGNTYAYRSYDMKKLSETNLLGWDVSGGSYGTDSVTDVANVRFESGAIYRLFGGGQGTTKDATIVLDGGAAWMTYGGAVEDGTVLHTTAVYEGGESKRRAYLGGITGSCLGDKDKTYGAEEYAAEVWFFDWPIQYLTLGANGGFVYGNIKYEQYGGSVLYLDTGGTKVGDDIRPAHYGDVDVTVYGGMWEKQFKDTKYHYGNTKLKLYDEIHRSEYIDYPNFLTDSEYTGTLDVEYFDGTDDFEFIEYENKREEMVDTSEDAGKLIVRFLETKVEGDKKGTVKIRDGTGDSIYITFPNGQNMLIDTGEKHGAQYIVQDLKDLGVETIDYLVITHDHGDHIGGIEAVSEAFEIKNLIYQGFNTNALLETVRAAEGAQVQIVAEGDVLEIGEVRFDVINPNKQLIEELKAADSYDLNQTSIAMVMSYGESKVFLGADSLYQNEKAWLANEEIKALISDCQLLKLNHHGICNTNTSEFLYAVNADKYVITQMREYGTQLGMAVEQLQSALGVTWDDIYVTGRHGMIKAVIGNDGTVDMSCQYEPVSDADPDPTPDPDPTLDPDPTPDPNPNPDPTPEPDTGDDDAEQDDDDTHNEEQDNVEKVAESSKTAGSTETGDDTPIMRYVLLLVVAAVAFVMVLVKKGNTQ